MNTEIDWDKEAAKARLLSNNESLNRQKKEDYWYNSRIEIAKKYLDSFGCENVLQSLRDKKLRAGEIRSGGIRKNEMGRVAGYEYYIYLQWPEFKQGDHQWHDEYYEGHSRWFDDDRFEIKDRKYGVSVEISDDINDKNLLVQGSRLSYRGDKVENPRDLVVRSLSTLNILETREGIIRKLEEAKSHLGVLKRRIEGTEAVEDYFRQGLDRKYNLG